MPDHILDRPIWGALNTNHAHLAIVSGAARRYRSDISPLAAIEEDDSDGPFALGVLLKGTGPVAVAQLGPITCPPNGRLAHEFAVHQMLLNCVKAAVEDPTLIRLGSQDAEKMLELANIAKPGPFALKTHELGEYWGIKLEGKLVAMAGERLKLPGYTEISGVATHPDSRGQGYAGRLCRHLMARIVGRGDTPFLHVDTTKQAVERMYTNLGFVRRKTLDAAVFEPA